MNRSFEIPKNPHKPYKNIFILVVFLAMFIWSLTGISYNGTLETAGRTMKNILGAFLKPDLAYAQNLTIDGLGYAILETLAIAISGTFISALLSLPFALLASQNLVGKKLGRLGKLIITIIRVFPELILAIIFVKVVGPGAMAGVLALGVHSIGMIGKLFYEGMEAMDMGPAEALDASGAKPSQKLFHAILPTVMTEMMSYTLYRFEINTRAASTLGVVGAGGIGTPLIFAISSRDWNRVSAIVLALIVMVVIVDYISGSIRKRLQ